ncbi:hypothetical protein B0G82_2173 [Paraburkholderia sp. BL17N1]|nr:hypothetical protein B0G82_2173 [Paraburkholderia sp. BL17N1]
MLEAFNLPVFTYDPRVTLQELHDRYRSGELDYVDYMDGRLRSLPYECGCFLAADIEPVLLDLIATTRSLAETPPARTDLASAAELVADVSASTISARNSGDDAVSLSPGPNDSAIVAAWVAARARALCAAGDTKESLAAKIINQIPHGALSERGPITLPSILRMMPAGITGGRSKNGRKSSKLNRHADSVAAPDLFPIRKML